MTPAQIALRLCGAARQQQQHRAHAKTHHLGSGTDVVSSRRHASCGPVSVMGSFRKKGGKASAREARTCIDSGSTVAGHALHTLLRTLFTERTLPSAFGLFAVVVATEQSKLLC